jgi:hypothetical protein
MYAEQDWFRLLCSLVGIDATARQASKYKQKKGKVYKFLKANKRKGEGTKKAVARLSKIT